MHKDSTAYTILVIEDNTGDALLIREYLHEHIASPEILEAATYAAAIRFLESRGNSIDFILLDLTLPDLRGEELIQGILDASGDIPVMVLTGYNDLGFAVRSMEMGVSDYFLKDDLTAFSLYKRSITIWSASNTTRKLNARAGDTTISSISARNPCAFSMCTP